MRIGSAAALIALCTACALVKPKLPPPLDPADAGRPPGPLLESESDPYRIQLGDVIAVRSYYDSQLDQEVVVRPDGRISLLFMGDVFVEGSTPSDLTQRIVAAYASVVSSPDVTVVVKSFAAARVYVGGEVRTPAVQTLSGRMTLIQATIAAGGFLPTANRKQIVVVRKEANGGLRAFTVDVDRILSGDAPDTYLSALDVVYVPKTPIAELDTFVDQYINEIIPQSVNITFGLIRQNLSGGSVSITTVP